MAFFNLKKRDDKHKIRIERILKNNYMGNKTIEKRVKMVLSGCLTIYIFILIVLTFFFFNNLSDLFKFYNNHGF